ncbi:hypothetical protein Gotri_006900 [Gossypium trilobum]|uniref:RNase H type-1 domain-containing protein n=1 Tax=Gossypium trilobum TaxID=34281 RepID=A0A7J9FGU5_9ROSI|nr:hypothetical protein [Gossypium trilobum]
MFCCAIWAIWKDRNKKVHDRKIIIGKDTANFVSSYMEELKRLEENTCTKRKEDVSWKAPSSLVIKINFDSAFDGRRFRLVSGVAVRDERGAVFFTHTSFHKGVVSAFAAEALACQLAVSTGFDNGWIRVIIEGDSLTTVKKYKEEIGLPGGERIFVCGSQDNDGETERTGLIEKGKEFLSFDV